MNQVYCSIETSRLYLLSADEIIAEESKKLTSIKTVEKIESSPPNSILRNYLQQLSHTYSSNVPINNYPCEYGFMLSSKICKPSSKYARNNASFVSLSSKSSIRAKRNAMLQECQISQKQTLYHCITNGIDCCN
jgi:hypothetical protein